MNCRHFLIGTEHTVLTVDWRTHWVYTTTGIVIEQHSDMKSHHIKYILGTTCIIRRGSEHSDLSSGILDLGSEHDHL